MTFHPSIRPSVRPAGRPWEFFDFVLVLISSVGVQRVAIYLLLSLHWDTKDPSRFQLSLYVHLSIRL